jgi:L-asparaginase
MYPRRLVLYGKMTSSVRERIILKAVFGGMPLAWVGRGAPQGFADPGEYFISGSNLGSTKARLVLMACLMKFAA